MREIELLSATSASHEDLADGALCFDEVTRTSLLSRELMPQVGYAIYDDMVTFAKEQGLATGLPARLWNRLDLVADASGEVSLDHTQAGERIELFVATDSCSEARSIDTASGALAGGYMINLDNLERYLIEGVFPRLPNIGRATIGLGLSFIQNHRPE